MNTPRLAHFVWPLHVPAARGGALRPVHACAGRLGAAGLSLLQGGNTSSPAEPVLRCFWPGITPGICVDTCKNIPLPNTRPLLTRTGWSAFIIALIAVCAVAPLLNLAVPADSAFHMSTYAVALLGKIMCYAICALAMDLIWGYTGILSLGHGVFFALGGYVMGMYLMRQIGKDGNYKSDLPDFMVFLDWKALPWHWTFSDSFIATLILIVAVPGLVAFVFGYFAFRSRIKGVYFSTGGAARLWPCHPL